MRRFLAGIIVLSLSILSIQASAKTPKTPKLPKGCTIYGQITSEGAALADVLVSDGTDIVRTDRNGWYFLRSDKHLGSVFVIFPSGYDVDSDAGVPQSWQHLGTDTAAERHDFSLRRMASGKYTVVAFTDLHLANIFDDERQLDALFQGQLKSEVAAARERGEAVYGLNLGDSSYDRYWYEDDFDIADWRETMRRSGFDYPVFTVMGNHDNDPATPSGPDADRMAEARYREVMGPTWYSFNLGDIHYVMLDNIIYRNSPGRIDDCEGVAGRRDYQMWFNDEELAWLDKDLATVAPSTPVVVGMHSPLFVYKGKSIVNKIRFDECDADSLLNVFTAKFKDFEQVHYVTGHIHKNRFCRGADDTSVYPYIYNVVDHNITSGSGTWWHTGAYGGLQLAPDGAPAGFEVFNVDGSGLSWYFVSGDDGAQKQFRVFDMNCVRDFYRSNNAMKAFVRHHPDFRDYASLEGDNLVMINVWAWQPDWTLKVYEIGVEGSLLARQELPVAYRTAENPQYTLSNSLPKANWRDLWPTKISKSPAQEYMFWVQASSADSTLEVTVTDSFGRSWTETVERPKAFSKLMR